MMILCSCGNFYTRQPYKDARTIMVRACIQCEPARRNPPVRVQQSVERKVVFSSTIRRPIRA